MVAHLTAVVERVTSPESRDVIIFLSGGAMDPSYWREQWLPTDLKSGKAPEGDEPVQSQPLR